MNRSKLALRCVVAFSLALLAASGCHQDGAGNDDQGVGPDIGTADIGTADIGTADIGTADIGTADIGGGPKLGLYDVDPGASSRQVSTDVSVSGFGIANGAGIRLVPCVNGLTVSGGNGDIVVMTVTVSNGGTLASFNLPVDNMRNQGLYSIVLNNPDGTSATLQCAFSISALAPPTVTNVQPASAWRGVTGDGVLSDQAITISGTGFEVTPRVVLRKRLTMGLGPAIDLYQVSWLSATTLTAVVPSETDSMALGDYTLQVINPNLLQGAWANPFQITGKAPPKIVSITPLSSSTPPQVVTLCGTGFDATSATPPPTAFIIVPPGTTCAAGAISIDPVSGLSRCSVAIGGTAAACGGGLNGVAITVGAYAAGAYPLEWVNGDGQQSVYYNFAYITSAQPGHLKGCWENGYDSNGAPSCDTVAPPVTPFPAMSSVRWRHGMTYDFDEFGNTYLFVAGGQASRTGAPLSSVEATQIDVFGRPGPWQDAKQFDPGSKTHVSNSLTTGRTGAGMVHLGAHLYVVGGSRASTANDNTITVDNAGTPGITKTTEHSFVLGYGTRPNIQLPQVTAVPPGTQGLPDGQWYYRVAGYDPVIGESLASREVAVRGGGKITVKWLPAVTTTGATTYNIYRSLASDGRANSEILVAAGVTGTSYVDDGQGQNQVAPGHLSSAAAGGGTFPATPALQPLTYVVSSTISGLERVSYATQILLAGVTETSVSLSWDSVPGATYNLYRFNYGTGGYERLASNLTDASKPYVDTNLATTATAPSFGEPPLRPGSLAKWALVEDPANAGQPLQMAVAREGLEATTIALTDGMNAVIYVAGGRSAVADADYLHAVESLKIPYASGLPTAGWKLQGNGTLAGANVVGHPLRHSRAFFALLNSQDHDVIPRAPDPKEPPCVDFDGDGYKPCSCFAQSVTLDAGACAAAGTITTVNSCDCNDTDPTIYPCGPDLCGDGIAQNCVADTMCPASCATPDVDADGHRALSCGGDDCCDTGSESSLGCSPATAGGVHPGATEICGNGIDENCDGIDPSCTTTCTTDADGDGRIACSCYPNGPPGTTACGAPNCDCNDANAAIYPCAPEIPCDGIAQSCLADSCQILSLQVPISWGVQRRSMASARSTIDPGALMSLPTAIFTPARAPATAAALICAPPVWIVAVQGQSAFNSGQNTIEACVVDSASGDLAQCDLAAAPTVPWTDQTAAAVGPKGLFGLGAQLWDIATLPTVGSWSGATDETLTAGPTITSSSGSFWNVDLTEDGACHFTPPNRTGCTAYGCGVYGNQSADSKFLARAYYRASRVAGYVFVVGGWLSSLGGVIGDLERHLQ